MNIGGMQITDGATKAPALTDEPPGTTRTRSATENLRAGKVSLSTNDRQTPLPISASSPSRKPSRMPCLTQALTIQRPSIFSAARILPWVSASRNSRNTRRASGSRAPSLSANNRSMEDCNDDMPGKYRRFQILDRRFQFEGQHALECMPLKPRQSEICNLEISNLQSLSYTHLHSLRIKIPVMPCAASRASPSAA